jgi:hypothetical protein
MKKSLLVPAAVFVSFSLIASAVHAEALYFFNNGSWNSVGNWYVPDPAHPGQYTLAGHIPNPSGGDDVTIDGTCDATGVTASLKSLTIWQGNTSVTGGNFDVGTLNFVLQTGFGGSGSTNGMTSSHVNVRASGSVNFADTGTFMTDCVLTLQGGSFANVTIGPTFSGTTIFNEGSFVIQGKTSGANTVFFLGSNNRFDNIGDIRGNGAMSAITAGSHNLILNNSGTIAAYAGGTLFINGIIDWTAEDAGHDGSFYPVTNDAAINITGPFVVPANTTTYFKGPGIVNTLGSLTVNGTLQVGVPASGPVTASRNTVAESTPAEPGHGVISGSATCNGTGIANVTGVGEVDMVSLVANGFSVMVKKGGKFHLRGPHSDSTDVFNWIKGSLDNHGAVTWQVGQVNVGNITITNEADGVVNSGTAGFVGNGGVRIDNIGNWFAMASTKTNPFPGNSGITDSAPVYNNIGKTTISGDGFWSVTGGTSSGGWTVQELQTALRFATNPSNLNTGTTFAGAGSVIVQAHGGIVVNGGITVPRLKLDGDGIIDGPDALSIMNGFDFDGGTIKGTGSLTFGPECDAVIQASFDKAIEQRTINNNGAIVWMAGSSGISASNGAIINNLSGGTFDILNDSALGGTLENTPTFNNLVGATFRKSGGTGTSTIGINFNTSGTVDLKSGTCNFYNFTQLDGTTILDGGNLGNVGGTPLLFKAGNCNGTATVNGDMTIGSAVSKIQMNLGPGFSPGKITINGNYTQLKSGTLDIEVAGLKTPGVNYDRLVVTGTATLGGTLHVTDINGFKPGPNDTVVPLTAGSISGKFDSTNAQVNYGSTSLTVAALPTAAAQLLNISTRMKVLTGTNVLIGGFIVTGTDAKKVLVRGLGPSLPVGDALADPTLELHDSSKTLASNNNWKDTQQAEIQATTIPPGNELESALIQIVPANTARYTAILAGKDGGTGIGLVEIYDLALGVNSKLANISTRGFVDTGDNVMIGGLILGPGTNRAAKVLARAIGPSLSKAGVADPLQDPSLELHDKNGAVIASNDNWKVSDSGGSQQSEIEATTIPPTDDRESALVRTLVPGSYTAIVRGKNNSTGVALVELYNLQ